MFVLTVGTEEGQVSTPVGHSVSLEPVCSVSGILRVGCTFSLCVEPVRPVGLIVCIHNVGYTLLVLSCVEPGRRMQPISVVPDMGCILVAQWRNHQSGFQNVIPVFFNLIKVGSSPSGLLPTPG